MVQFCLHVYLVAFLDLLLYHKNQLWELALVYDFYPVRFPDEKSWAIGHSFENEIGPLLESYAVSSDVNVPLGYFEYGF